MEEESLDIKNLLHIKHAYSKYLNFKLSNENLTSSYSVFVEALSQQNFHSQQELTNFLGCNKAHTSRTLIKMQMKGLIAPIYPGHNEIKLTDKGQVLAKKVANHKREMISELFKNVTNEEKIIFEKVLNQMIENAKIIEEAYGVKDG